MTVAPPAAMLACAADPAPPASPASMGALLDYTVRLWQAGEDCRSHLADVAAWARGGVAPDGIASP